MVQGKFCLRKLKHGKFGLNQLDPGKFGHKQLNHGKLAYKIVKILCLKEKKINVYEFM